MNYTVFFRHLFEIVYYRTLRSVSVAVSLHGVLTGVLCVSGVGRRWPHRGSET